MLNYFEKGYTLYINNIISWVSWINWKKIVRIPNNFLVKPVIWKTSSNKNKILDNFKKNSISWIHHKFTWVKHKNIFFKKIENNVDFYFKRYKLFYSVISKINWLSTPKPLMATKNWIIFEKLDLWFSLYEAIRNNMNIDKSLFFKIWEKLWKLHKMLNSKSFNSWKWIIWGDCWVWNIFYKGNYLFFIDFELPHDYPFNSKLLNQWSFYLDVCYFIHSIDNFIYYKNPIVWFKSRKTEITLFLNWYEKWSWIKLDLKTINKYLKYYSIYRLKNSFTHRNHPLWFLNMIFYIIKALKYETRTRL